MIATLSAEKTRLEKLITQQIRSHQQLSCDHQLLCTIKGIGSLTAAILLAEMARPGQVERARQAAAHAGLVPRHELSGTSVALFTQAHETLQLEIGEVQLQDFSESQAH